MHTIIAANWKMYKTRAEAETTAQNLAELLGAGPGDNRDVLVFAPFTTIHPTAQALCNVPNVAVGGQDVYPATEGAFTGEISPAMLKDCGAAWVLTGHSERRHVLGESSAFVGQKTAFALEQGLKVMLCIGETLQEREAGKLEAVLKAQLDAALRPLPASVDGTSLAVAYEPVWAIGTGKVASECDIIEAHGLVRDILGTLIGSRAAKMPILYGGSVKPDNAGSILGLDNVNGLLVGGASLQAESFIKIIRAGN